MGRRKENASISDEDLETDIIRGTTQIVYPSIYHLMGSDKPLALTRLPSGTVYKV